MFSHLALRKAQICGLTIGKDWTMQYWAVQLFLRVFKIYALTNSSLYVRLAVDGGKVIFHVYSKAFMSSAERKS